MQMEDSDFRPVADTAGFIVAHPLGAPIIGPGLRGWNFGNDSLPDDVLFTSEMIDTIAADFNINLDRVYACGMSYGGFFSVYLAGRLSDRIASIASVAGTILTNVPDSAISPIRPIAFLEIHGTDDNNVAYNGSQLSRSVQHVLDLFVDLNNCDTIPSITPLPDINPNDGSTVEHFVYANGDNGTTVEHLKINGGRHTWPDENTNAQGVNRDINGCVEIWKFFSRFDMNGSLESPSSIGSIPEIPTISIYPNPVRDVLSIKSDDAIRKIEVFHVTGQMVLSRSWVTSSLSLERLPKGTYLLKIETEAGLVMKKVIKD